ncbi:phosphoribosyltransferase [Clostridium tagluense]|uniref:phosphoribosyltransferase n=1 Tax=Clostridium tagluense TaxID=360422 RepID=UPI001CF2C595|nr:phosphoribosyltransferase family protein [Clostridium tagluense]MCB2313060.1 phosphoribosyltransferase [Clostridium tagluense]MCB2317831.1 phosphoribosyltransferase [Clostridium tagluense]MCB2322616.1 phosphoribosyltransferase [Clostridium tagluense]MCB2327609.1 phosphoribosyltransferase [Clostridium tagluense]MCB2332260.1 phosphoribosyltransferase [Clostridium tagluense]
MMFLDRMDAGEKLADSLYKFKDEDVIVLAVPRGGIAVGYDTIKRYGLKWDLIIPRKIGAPHNKEFAIGAVSVDGSYFLNNDYVKMFGISQDYIEKEVLEQTVEIKRRMQEYRGVDTFPEVKGKTVIIIDDGIATGFTILAVIKAVKKQGAKKIILAIPVGPRETIEEFKEIVDEVICLYIPENFYAVGSYYENFKQVTDVEVFIIIHELRG